MKKDEHLLTDPTYYPFIEIDIKRNKNKGWINWRQTTKYMYKVFNEGSHETVIFFPYFYFYETHNIFLQNTQKHGD